MITEKAKAIALVTDLIFETNAKKATKYLSRTEVVKATRRHKRRKNERTVEMVLTFGKPNYAERQFIKRAIAAGEPFPVKRALLKFERAA